MALGPGDLVIMYTDGVTEAFDAQYAAFGEERLVRIVKECRTLPASIVMERIISGIREFTGSAPQSDDITLVVIPGALKIPDSGTAVTSLYW